MDIKKSQVNQLTIKTDGLDPIKVFTESFYHDLFDNYAGCMTIVCFNKAWTARWGAMGKDTPTVEEFVQRCDNDYIIKNLDSQMQTTEIDTSRMVEDAKKTIIRRRREEDLCKETARNLFELADRLDILENDECLLCEIYGDDWWGVLPTCPSSEYEYLTKITETVRNAFALKT